MAITAFETGKWYVCSAKERPDDWNDEGYMDALLDGRPHKCTVTSTHHPMYACFAETHPERTVDGTWTFCGDESLFTEAPIMSVIENLPISYGTKAYALSAVSDMFAHPTAFSGFDPAASCVGALVDWRSTAEGPLWWGTLSDGKDPGIPGGGQDGCFSSSMAFSGHNLVNIDDVPIGSRVKVVSLAETDGYYKDQKCREIITGKDGIIQSDGRFALKDNNEYGPFTLDRGAKVIILPATTNAPAKTHGVKEFVAGRWYRYNRQPNAAGWEDFGGDEKRKVLDGKPRKCIRVHKEEPTSMELEGVEGGFWSYSFNCMDEVPAPVEIGKLMSEAVSSTFGYGLETREILNEETMERTYKYFADCAHQKLQQQGGSLTIPMPPKLWKQLQKEERKRKRKEPFVYVPVWSDRARARAEVLSSIKFDQ